MRIFLVFALLPLPVFGAEPGPREAALADIASGDLDRGVSRLRRAVSRGEPAEPGLRCLLARAEALAGQHAAAARTWAAVPADAPCARQAAFGRADALRAVGKEAEAARVYAEHAVGPLGPERDASLVRWLEELAARALSEEKISVAQGLYALALSRAEPLPARVALAHRVAEALGALPADERPAPPAGLAEALLAGLATQDDPAGRRRVAPFLPPAEGLALLSGLPPEPATRVLAARLAAEVDVERQLRLLDGVTGAEATRSKHAATLIRAKLGRQGAALSALAAGAGDEARDASNARIDLLLAAGDHAGLVPALEGHLKRFPSDPRRTENEQRLDAAQISLARAALAAGRAQEAIRRYDALVARDPRSPLAAQAAWEASLVVRRAAPKEARRRWQELMARWPDTAAAGQAVAAMARDRAFDQEDPEGAIAALEALAADGRHQAAANAELSRLRSPAITIRTTPQRPGGDARVEVVARNLEWVEARLHAVDPRGYLRAGGLPTTLAELDVAVIAPDRRWKVKVPRYARHRDVAFDLAVPEVDPGLYVITVASEDREASAVLWVSDVRLVASAVGPDIAAAVFRGDTPASGADVWVRLPDGRVETGRTDRSGLFRTRLKTVGPVTLLALARGAPALLRLERGEEALPAPAYAFTADLDRPIHRPGDRVGFRITARRAGAPVAGAYSVWLADGDVRYGGLTLEAGPFGTVHGALRLPAAVSDSGIWRRSLALMVQGPGEDTGRQVAVVRVAPQGPPERTLHAWTEGTGGVVAARDADGTPISDLLVRYRTDDGREGAARTDAAGRVSIPGVPAGVRWGFSARVAGADLGAEAQRPLPAPRPLSLQVADLAAGETAVVRLRGPDGRYALSWAALSMPPAPSPAPTDPWVPEVEIGVTGADGAPVPVPAASAVEGAPTQRMITIEGGEAAVEVPSLAAGHWQVRAVALAEGPSAQVRFRVGGEAPGLAGLSDVRAGATLPVRLLGAHPALLTVGRDRLFAAEVLPVGGTRTLRPDGRWGGTVSVQVLDAEGALARRDIEVDPALDVQITATPLPSSADAPARWRLEARVTDGAARPVKAEVALRVVDTTLEAFAGVTQSLDVDALAEVFPAEAVSGAFVRFVQAALASPIAAELLAEAAREAEAQKAQLAAQGRFGQNAVSDVLESPPIGNAMGFGGLGTVGRGAGGGGFGRGMGRVGVRQGKASARGSTWIRGARAPVAWAVLTTDAAGVVRLEVPRPQRPGAWRFTAQAVSATGFGAAEEALETGGEVRLLSEAPGPGAPGASAQLRVTVHNGAPTPFSGAVLVDGVATAVEVPAGAAKTLDLGPRQPGASAALRLEAKGRLVAQRAWSFPLADGAPAEDGRVVTVAAAPGGGVPAAWLALRADPAVFRDYGRTAVAGRAALAALKVAPEAAKPMLEARVAAARYALRSLTPASPRAAAAGLLFLAEARGRLSIPKGEIEEAERRLSAPGALPADRVAVLHARAAAGLEVDASALARLERLQDLPAEVSARLARVLILQGRAKDAKARIAGDGPQAILARRALEQRATAVPSAPPLPGDWTLPDWIAAHGAAPGRDRGQATVRLGEAVIGNIDRGAGGVLRAVMPAKADMTALRLDGLKAIAWRGNPAPAGAADPEVVRLPILGDGSVWGAANPRAAARIEGEVLCADPCVLEVGDALAPVGDLRGAGWTPPAGLRRVEVRGGVVLRAEVPGQYVLAGLEHPDGGLIKPTRVEVRAEAGVAGLSRSAALSLAEEAVVAERDPSPWLAPWPHDSAWLDALLGQRAQIRFAAALHAKAGPEVLVDRFEALREARPKARLTSEEIARVATAYAAAGKTARAVDIWRAGLNGAFLAEAATARQVEAVAGLLPSLQGLRRIADRYPALPAVDQAMFLLPQRLEAMAEGGLPEEVKRAGITPTDVHLMTAAWDRAYIALWPSSERRAEAGFHLVRTLQGLDAHAEAARWAALLAKQHADSPVLDGFLFQEGLSRLRLRQDARALALFARLSDEEFPQSDGSRGPAGSRHDARYALARLYEARGELGRARTAYAAAAESHAEAARAVEALEAVVLQPEAVVKVKGSGRLELPVVLANVDTVHLRAYRLDLRTIFLRDGGLSEILGVNVSGVSPIWSGEREVDSNHFPRTRKLALPLDEKGAYLVQLDGGGQQGVALVVRSDLALDARPDPEGLRLTVRRSGKPAAGVQIRSAGDGVAADTTDVRGVATVPGPNVLAFTEGGDVAFAPGLEDQGVRTRRRPARPRSKKKSKSNIDMRLERQIRGNKQMYEQEFQLDNDAGVELELL